MSSGEAEKYAFLLFVADHEAEARTSFAALREALDRRLAGNYRFEIIDVLQNPERADAEKVFATPMLVRTAPVPALRILGDLGDPDKVLSLLQLEPGNG